MKKITQYAGVILIVLGALTLAATRIPSLVSSNALLLTGVLTNTHHPTPNTHHLTPNT